VSLQAQGKVSSEKPPTKVWLSWKLGVKNAHILGL